MKFVFTLAAAALCVATQAQAFTEEMYSVLPVPRGDVPGYTLGLNHTFLSKVVVDNEVAEDLPEKKFGLRGANVGFTWSWLPINHVSVRAIARSGGPDFMLGAGTHWSTELISANAGSYFQFRYVDESWKKTYVPFAAVSSPWLTSFGVDLTLNAAYDAYNSLIGTGVGLAYDFNEDHRFLAEYFPRLEKINERKPDLGKKDSFGFGYRYHSFGHQYFLMLTNSKAVDLTQAIWGADTNDLGIAIRVNREM